MHFIVDAHQDLAYNALTFDRDYSRPALATRERESGTETIARNGNTLLGLADFLLGHVGVIFSTLFAAPQPRTLHEWDTQVYADAAQAHRVYARQLDYYRQLVDEHEVFRLIGARSDLESVLATWQGDQLTEQREAPMEKRFRASPTPTLLAQRRIGLVPLMEGADGIRDPKEAEWWMERGVRIIGLAWSGTRYAGGTGAPGPLTPNGRQLLNVMADLGLMLDLSHASDESYLEALDRFPGVALASHANPRARVKDPARPERFLSDEMIRRLAERGGVIGVVPYNRFLKADWKTGDPKDAVTLNDVASAIDHICQVTGSAAHVGLGSDFDGGFGVEATPAEIDTIADLQKLGPVLAEHGYGEKDISGIMGGNWIKLLRRGLPG
ncbi:MAG: dipeptidase [Anaerolineales bacterium]